MDVAFSEPGLAAPSTGRSSRWTAAIVLLGLSGVFLVSLLYKPPDGDYISICLFKDLTGLPCPGCGLTHSFCALAKGNFARAFGYNAMGPLMFVLAVAFWLRWWSALLGRTGPVIVFDRVARGPGLAKLLLCALGAYGVGRIIYILLFHPELRQSAALLKIITGLAARL